MKNLRHTEFKEGYSALHAEPGFNLRRYDPRAWLLKYASSV